MSSKSNRTAFLIKSALLLSVLCTVAAAKTIYVDDATGANNGTSRTDSYTFLQEALADARLAEKPVEIRVAQGTYKPNQGLGAAPEFDWRTATFLDAGWDFADETGNGTEDIWWIDEGKDYPRL